jgi:hypothetical protein
MSGQLFYNKRGIRITDASLNIQGGTYPFSGIQHTDIRVEPPHRVGPIVCIIVGAFLTITIIGSPLGVPLLIGGTIWLTQQKPTHWLVVQTPSGRCELYSSKDGKVVREIQGALAAAIAHASSSPMPLLQHSSTPANREELMLRLLKAAQAHSGQLSVTEGVIETGASFSDVETTLKEMAKTGYVSVENHPETGIVMYKFVEIS